MTDRWPLESLVGSVRALLEELESRFQIDVVLQGAVSCHPGCTNCCHWPVAASPLEGLIILDHLKHNRMWSKAVQNKLRASADQVTGLAYHVWRAANIPCPLLKDGKCIVWEARPMACRVAASRGDPDECHPHQLATASGLIPFAEVIVEFRSREAALLRSQDIRIRTLPLATAVLVAAQIRDAGIDMMPYLTLNEYFRRAV